ncbi:NAD-dependent epimerase/dehydratase family protein [Tabrizicola sp. J26]|uniref:NAD-dependent epimerase/dehydratase family protein n=1 Tax=Alitabrizicola rongguiensis TaxID=2909234 RepID=UPI001F19E65B|nr:NAD-dependent epimerase/dehydratase family protein [Tabrizicola rongguiensis]MCF1708012.1 NAD-dependent epimerase/dehydratase family protein [Tabrizicola rongguiensis]
MTDTVLLTGITGFLGGHLALELLRSGYHVRGSLRNPDRARATRAALAAAGADVDRLDFVTLDLTRDEGWSAATEGARFVMHSASPFVTTMPKDPQVLIRPAVDGTGRAMRAGLSAGVERIVLTSSTVAIAYGRGRNGPPRLGPDDWADPASPKLSAYGVSKTLAERHAWSLVEGQEDRLAVINPGLILGPLIDDDTGTSGAVIQRFLRGQIPVAPDLYFHVVDVRDLARIHVAALTAPRAAGHRHIAAFHSCSVHDVGQILARHRPDYARKMPKLRAPDWIIRLYSLFDGDMRSNVPELGYCPKLDASGSLRLLGHPPRSLEETLGAMADSLIERKLV